MYDNMMTPRNVISMNFYLIMHTYRKWKEWTKSRKRIMVLMIDKKKRLKSQFPND